MAVMARHTGLSIFKGGYLGVDFFFVLSGFLITALILEQYERDRFSFARFYARRALRLLPALMAVLAVVGAYAFAAHSTTAEHTRHALLPALFYFSDWARAFGSDLGLLSHTWSLAIEEQFYVLWPVLLIWSLSRGGYRRSGVVAGLVLALSIATTAARYLMGVSPNALYSGLESHGAVMLLSGCALAICLESAPLTRLDATARAARLGFPLAVLVTIALFVRAGFLSSFYALGGYALLAACAVVLIGHTVLDTDGAVGKLLRARPLVAVGRVSYGLYLWHYVVYRTISDRFPHLSTRPRILVEVPLSFAVAAASYFVIERPFLRLKRRFSDRPRSLLSIAPLTAN